MAAATGSTTREPVPTGECQSMNALMGSYITRFDSRYVRIRAAASDTNDCRTPARELLARMLNPFELKGLAYEVIKQFPTVWDINGI